MLVLISPWPWQKQDAQFGKQKHYQQHEEWVTWCLICAYVKVCDLSGAISDIKIKQSLYWSFYLPLKTCEKIISVSPVLSGSIPDRQRKILKK